ncbi:MAG: glycosyltransferase family 4 protein [Crenarchaeota archaeon]|nr:glycosyltransferase family 4 protein [Thermoproteota archaeon]
MKVTISNSFRILYVTDRFLQSRYPSPPIAKTVNASNVDLAEYNRDVLKQRLAKPAKEIIVFGMIGNFKTTYKGVHTAIEALSQIKDKYKFVFKVLGKGDTLKYINLAKDFDIDDYVFFCGSLPNGRPVLNWLDQLDIYLQPSLAEGLPRALIEAMSRGLPCVASKTGGIPELLEPRFLHNPGNAKDLKNKILYILSLNLSEISKENFDRVKQYNSNSLNKKRFVFFEDLKNAAIRNLQ